MATRSNTVLSSITNSLRKENAESNKKIIENTGMTAQLVKEFIGSLKDRQRKDDIERKEDKLEKKKSSGITGMLKSIPTSGLIPDFLSTMLTGKAGFFSGLKSALSGKAMMGLGRGVAGLLVGPQLLEAVEAAFAEKDMKSGIIAGLNAFFDDKSSYKEKLGLGALAGFAFAGPKGLLAGVLVAGLWGGLQYIAENWGTELGLGKDKETAMKTLVNEYVFGPAGGLLLGTAVGFKTFGLPGAVIGAALSAAGLIITDVIENYSNQPVDSKNIFGAVLDSVMTFPKTTTALTGAGIGFAMASGGGLNPLTGLGGAILGGVLGFIAGAIGEFLRDIGLGDWLNKIFARFRRAITMAKKGLFSEAMQIIETGSAIDYDEINQLVKEGKTSEAVGKLLKGQEGVSDEEIRRYESSQGSLKAGQARAQDEITKKFEEFRTTNNYTYNNEQVISEFGKSLPSGGLLAPQKANLELYVRSMMKQNEAIKQQNSVLTQLLGEQIDITGLTPDQIKIYIDQIQEKELSQIPQKATGAVFTKPQVFVAGESPRNNPEILFNRQQLEALGSLFQMQYENDAMRRGGMGDAMISTPVTQYVDNRTTMQESFNVTEILPAPSIYSFGDHLPA
jgi:hypothetical protein